MKIGIGLRHQLSLPICKKAQVESVIKKATESMSSTKGGTTMRYQARRIGQKYEEIDRYDGNWYLAVLESGPMRETPEEAFVDLQGFSRRPTKPGVFYASEELYLVVVIKEG